MSAELGAVESQLRREIEALEKERREGDQAFENKKQAIIEARERCAAARGDGDKVTLLKEEMKAKLLAQKKDVLTALRDQNNDVLEVLKAELDMAKNELRQVREDKKGQQQIFLILREKGVAEFQNYSPGLISEASEEDTEQLKKQPSFSVSLSAAPEAAPPAEEAAGEDAVHVNIAGEGDEAGDMYDEPAIAANAA